MSQVAFPSVAVCTLAAVFIANAADPRLRIEPAQPHPGGMITVTFDPKGGPLEKSHFTADIRIPEGAGYLTSGVGWKTAIPAKETLTGGACGIPIFTTIAAFPRKMPAS
jgi:hypothetical protein